MDRRDYITLSGSALLTTALAGCAGETEDGTAADTEGDGAADATATETDAVTTAPSDTAADTEADTATETEAATTTSGSESVFGPETFSGSGTTTTDSFELANAPLTAEYSYDGELNFQTTLIAMEGESYNDVYLTNAIGSVEGSKVANVTSPGPYQMDVQADGEWEITLEQVANPSPESLPIDASGSGPTYLGPFEFGGATSFQASHSGEGNFIVQSVSLDTFGIGDIVFNEVGEFEGTTTARPGDMAYLNVQAGGDWTLSTSE